MIQLKLIAIAAAAAAVFYGAWSWRGTIAQAEVAKVADEVRAQAASEMAVERAIRSQFQDQVSAQLQGLSTDLRRLRDSRPKTQAVVASERATNPDFYSQPLPDAGRQAWTDARANASEPQSAASQPR